MAVDDLVMTEDYATEKLRLEMSPAGRRVSSDDGVTRLRPPPPPAAVASDQYHALPLGGHVCAFTGVSHSADTVSGLDRVAQWLSG